MHAPPPNIVRASYVELIVTDLAAARWFWVDMLGFVVSGPGCRRVLPARLLHARVLRREHADATSPSAVRTASRRASRSHPDEEVLRWSVHDMRRRDFWGAAVVPSWYSEATDVLDLDGKPSPLRAVDPSTSEATVGADGLR